MLLIIVGVSSLALSTFAMVVRGRGTRTRKLVPLSRAATLCLAAAPLPLKCLIQHVSSAVQVAPLLPPSSNRLVAVLQADRYYHLLVPLTVPVTLIMVGIWQRREGVDGSLKGHGVQIYPGVALAAAAQGAPAVLQGGGPCSWVEQVLCSKPFRDLNGRLNRAYTHPLQIFVNWFSMKLFKHNS